MGKNVVMVARDAAPSQAGLMLAKELTERGFLVKTFFGKGKPIPNEEEIPDAVMYEADVVWIGMSSSHDLSKPERMAVEAAIAGKVPFGLYADIFGCYQRPWFEPYRQHVRFLFVLNEGEREKAKKLFPHADVFASGNPVWETFPYPEVSRADVRTKLGIADDDYMILCLGTKFIPANYYMWVSVLQALHMMGITNFSKFKVVFSPHPGDETIQKGLNVYAELEKYNGGIPVRFVLNEEMGGPQMVAGADVIISPGSTEAIRAAYLRVPAIDYFSVVSLSRLQETCGSKTWEPCELGITAGVYTGDPSELARVMEYLLTEAGRERMALMNRENCPVKEIGTATRIMSGVLTEWSE